MGVSFPSLPRGYRYPQEQVLTSFAGGLNIRDADSELAANEYIDAMNVTLDERGGFASRLGYVKYNASAYGGGSVTNVFYWEGGQHLIVQAGTRIYLDDVTSSVHTFSTSELVTFAEIAGQVVACHPTDGLYVSTDGSTWKVAGTLGTVTVTIATPGVFSFNAHGLIVGDPVYFETTGALPTGLTADTTYYVIAAGLTANAFEVSTTAAGSAVNTSGSQSGVHTLFRAGAPKGQALVTWQNKLWVSGQTANPARVTFSKAGNPNYWIATDYVDIRDKDDAQVLALTVGSGLDIGGSAGMLAFKRDSTYRINDSTTGAYQTVDATVGAAGPLAVHSVGAKVFAISEHGIYWWQNGMAGMQPAAAQLQPLWDASQINFAKLNLMCVGRVGRKLRFSLPRAGSTANDLAFELHADLGWITPRTDAASCYASYGKNTEYLVGGSPTVTGQVYRYDSGGTDDGAAISGWLQTRWMDLLGGYKASVLHLRCRGRGTGTVEIRADYHETGDTQQLVMQDASHVLYDSHLRYDTDLLYYVPADEPTATVYGVGTCRQLSLKFAFTCSTTVNAPNVLNNTGTLPQEGPFAVFLVETLFMRLGLS